MKMIDVAQKLPLFTSNFLNSLKEGTIYLAGVYNLGEKYDLGLIEQLPVHIHKVKEKQIIDCKEKENNKILMVSDMFFCLFEQERWTKNNLTLCFWSNIKALITIKKQISSDQCRFIWKQRNKKVIFLTKLFRNRSSRF